MNHVDVLVIIETELDNNVTNFHFLMKSFPEPFRLGQNRTTFSTISIM